jgi:hypothetical protein
MGNTHTVRFEPVGPEIEVELIKFDEEILSSGTPIRTHTTVVEGVKPPIADIRFLRPRPEEPLEYKPGRIAEVDAYVCGPPPIVESAIARPEVKGVPESRIYFDKSTTSADA